MIWMHWTELLSPWRRPRVATAGYFGEISSIRATVVPLPSPPLPPEMNTTRDLLTLSRPIRANCGQIVASRAAVAVSSRWDESIPWACVVCGCRWWKARLFCFGRPGSLRARSKRAFNLFDSPFVSTWRDREEESVQFILFSLFHSVTLILVECKV